MREEEVTWTQQSPCARPGLSCLWAVRAPVGPHTDIPEGTFGTSFYAGAYATVTGWSGAVVQARQASPASLEQPMSLPVVRRDRSYGASRPPAGDCGLARTARASLGVGGVSRNLRDDAFGHARDYSM